MKLTNFTIIVTDACNRNCSYCPQKKENKTISIDTVRKALEFFFPLLQNNAVINFYGGEPLLGFDVIRETVEWVTERCRTIEDKEDSKPIDFSITTNGSLLNREILEYFNLRQFSMLVSFDGLAQEITRGQNDSAFMVDLIGTINRSYPDIKLKINSVFTPATISLLADSVRFVSELGVPNKFVLSKMEDWGESALLEYEKQMNKLADAALSEYKKSGSIRVENFMGSTSPPVEGLFVCNACKKRMAISPEAHLWGCYMFHDYFKGKEKNHEYSQYSLGHLDDFIAHHSTRWSEKCSKYSGLRIDNSWTDKNYCFLCENVYRCNVCPVTAAYSAGGTEDLGYIPSWICKINKINSRIKDDFFHRIQHKAP